jgi:hypothetical protein
MYICVWGIDFAFVSTILLSDFGTVSTTLRFWDCFYDFQILGLFLRL